MVVQREDRSTVVMARARLQHSFCKLATEFLTLATISQNEQQLERPGIKQSTRAAAFVVMLYIHLKMREMRKHIEVQLQLKLKLPEGALLSPEIQYVVSSPASTCILCRLLELT